ncbi:MAG: DUF4280 domain-containing protein [Defluviitaleaceae bacterium]|nr:DUF4280 domain-containing protein [Defluviitaleaceae bacterium]
MSHGVYINGKKAANVADHVGGHNILTFVNCMRSWPPPPCTYPTINKWVNGKENTWIDGEHQLLNVSVNFCMFGGVISVVNDGQ